MIRRLVLAPVLLAAALGCGNWKRVDTEPKPRPSETLTALLNAQQFYQRLGRLAAGDPMPFVGTVAFTAGPGDSVVAVLGLSLENRAFAFQREGNTFVARYRVEDTAAPESSLHDEQLREERERFVRRYQDPAVAAGFRTQCERLDRGPAA